MDSNIQSCLRFPEALLLAMAPVSLGLASLMRWLKRWGRPALVNNAVGLVSGDCASPSRVGIHPTAAGRSRRFTRVKALLIRMELAASSHVLPSI